MGRADGGKKATYAVEAHVSKYTIKVKTVREIVNEWLDTYNRNLVGTQEAEELIKQLESIN